MKKNQDSKDVRVGVINTLTQIFATAALAGELGANPIAAGGGAFVSQILSLGGKFKMRKAERFVSEFGKYMQSVSPTFDPEYVNGEDFHLFFEEVIIKASRTRSEEKLRRFRNIALNQMVQPIEFDLADKFLELTNRLSDNQIAIISHFMSHEQRRNEAYEKKGQLNAKVDQNKPKNSSLIIDLVETRENKEIAFLKTEIANLEKILLEIDGIREGLLVSISEEVFDFLLAELKSFGLIDQIKDSARYRGMEAFRAHEVSRLGISFIHLLLPIQTKALAY